jgi:hypothetical protein
VTQVAGKTQNVLTERGSAMHEDPIVNSLIYLLMFLCLLEFWLTTGVIQ